jgi:hypothetical protein
MVNLNASVSKNLKESAEKIKTSVGEFVKDITQGRITDALFGRHTSNLEDYEKVLITVRKGDRVAKLLLPFHRIVLSISKKDAEEVAIRLSNT